MLINKRIQKLSRRNPGEYRFLKNQKLRDRSRTLAQRSARIDKYQRRVI